MPAEITFLEPHIVGVGVGIGGMFASLLLMCGNRCGIRHFYVIFVMLNVRGLVNVLHNRRYTILGRRHVLCLLCR